MKIKKADEVSVEEAATFLEVSPRSIINYIQSNEIQAIKVGKAWHINKASLDAFDKRYGFRERSKNPENTENTEIKQKKSPTIPKVSETQGRSKKREVYPVHNLRLFQIAQKTLCNIGSQPPFPKRPDLQQRLLTLKAEALEYLGAGFYAFSKRNKAVLYNRSREKVGGMLSLIYFYHKEANTLPDYVLEIEEDLMAAYSALIRKIEKSNEKP